MERYTEERRQSWRAPQPAESSPILGRAPRRRGFTIVEILVVLGIISILLGGLIVAVGVGQGQARRAASRGLISKLATALASYRGATGLQYRIPPDGFDLINVPIINAQSRVWLVWVDPSDGSEHGWSAAEVSPNPDMSGLWEGSQCLVYFLCTPQVALRYDPELTGPPRNGYSVERVLEPFLAAEDLTRSDFPAGWFGEHQTAAHRKSISAFLQKLRADPTFFDGSIEDKTIPPFVDGFFGEGTVPLGANNAIHYDLRGAGGVLTDMDQANGKAKHGFGAGIPVYNVHDDPDPRKDPLGAFSLGDANGYDLWSHADDGHKRAENPEGQAPTAEDDIRSWKMQ